jgi:hypothetical protein
MPHVPPSSTILWIARALDSGTTSLSENGTPTVTTSGVSVTGTGHAATNSTAGGSNEESTAGKVYDGAKEVVTTCLQGWDACKGIYRSDPMKIYCA